MKLDIEELEKRVSQKLIKKFVHPSGNYIGWNYTDKCQYDKCWDEYTMFCRGAVTLPDGTLISRPFPKFFNLGEQEAGIIDFTEPMEITEKYDGSLIVVSFYNGNMIVNSRGSFTSDHANFATSWLLDNMASWVTNLKKTNPMYTFCFEAIFPENDSTVINYGDWRELVLLSIIETHTGKELKYYELQEFANRWELSLVSIYDDIDIYKLIEKCDARKIEEGEGIVIHFLDSNKRVKVKSKEYVRIHKLMSYITDKNIVNALSNGEDLEYIYSRLPDETYKEFQNTVQLYSDRFDQILNDAILAANEAKSYGNSRKDIAKFIMSNPKYDDIKGVIFTIIDGGHPSDAIWKVIKKKYI
jgi:RNA ligase